VRVAVVIPVYNEARWVREAVRRLLASRGDRPAADVFVVDDGSSDGSRAIIEALANESGITPLFHERNRGKGAAIRTGIAAAVAACVDVVLIHDADLEYDPMDHSAVLAPIFDGRADAVIGSRFTGQTHRVLYYWHSVANGFITTLCNMATNLNLTDVECCTKAFTRPVLLQMKLKEERFGIEIELVAKVAKVCLPNAERSALASTHTSTPASTPTSRRARVYEVAISYSGRTYDEGKKISWKDGLAAVWCIGKYGPFG